MKFTYYKKSTIFVLLIVFFLTVAYSLPSHPISFQASLGTSAIYYGDQTIVNTTNTFFTENVNRFILNTDVSVNLILDDYIRLAVGTILGFDWFKKDNIYMFLLDYDFYGGVRIYPMLKGFNFGIDYVCGGYTNYSQLVSTEIVHSEKGMWSNGFRISTEYSLENFDSFGISPAFGCYWQNMPRNGGFDNKLSVYAKLNIR